MKNLKNAVLTALMIFSLTSNVSAIFGSKKKGDTELHTAVRNKNLNEVVGILNQNPELVNSQNNAGDTPLHVAVSLLNGKIKILKWNNIVKICFKLIGGGAKLDIKNYKEEIPLDSFINADEFNHSSLNEVAALLLYFDKRVVMDMYKLYYNNMRGFFDDVIKEKKYLSRSVLKEILELYLVKYSLHFSLDLY